jgi:4'-phosphopantetheinyl transferase
MDPAVGVWWVATSVAPPDSALLPLLDAAERARLASYQEPRAARMFVVGAALVRCLVARERGLSPSNVPVDRACRDCGKPHGRPVLDPTTDGLQVSVSHSGGLVGVALARWDVGLDVEALDRRVDLLPRAAELLSPAELAAESDRLSEDPEYLLLWWTRKEAVLKLLGTGLRRHPSTFSLRIDGDAVEVSTEDVAPQRLGLRRLECHPGFVSSLATRVPAQAVEHDAAGLLDEGVHRAASA